ncbi:hypothetical protein OOZ51_21355 [Arthrobacter sp. MI7-26]|nr:hypothetical protein [Arthrobacter sp. MI7-26]
MNGRQAAYASSVDGLTRDVNNNLWIAGDDEECVSIESPHANRVFMHCDVAAEEETATVTGAWLKPEYASVGSGHVDAP